MKSIIIIIFLSIGLNGFGQINQRIPKVLRQTEAGSIDYESQGRHYSTHLFLHQDGTFTFYSVYEVGYVMALGSYSKNQNEISLNWNPKKTIEAISDTAIYFKYFKHSNPRPIQIENVNYRISNDSLLLIVEGDGFGKDTNIIKLKNAYIELKKNNSLSNQENYLKIFPSNFKSFNTTFGYEPNKPAELYKDSYDYISELFALDSILMEIKLSKYIDIAIGGKWDADAVNYFQNALHKVVLSNVNELHVILERKTSQEINSFFYFFFNSIHPKFKSIPKEFDSLKNNKRTYDLIKNAHKQAISNEH